MTLIANDYYWIYSTLAQSLAALIGVTGVFAVFRLQWVEREIDKVIQALKNYFREVSDMPHLDFERLTEKDLIIAVDKHIKRLEKNNENEKKRREIWEHGQDDKGTPLNDAQGKIAPESIASLTNAINQRLSIINGLEFRKENIFAVRDHRNTLASKALWLIGLLSGVFLLSIIGLIFSKFSESNLNYGLFLLIFTTGFLITGVVLLFKFCIISFRFGLNEVDVARISGEIKRPRKNSTGDAPTNLLIIFLMIVTILVTINYSNQQIQESKRSTKAQISALKQSTDTQIATYKISMEKQIGAIKDSAEVQIKKMNSQIALLKTQTELLKDQVFLSNSLSISQLGDRALWNTSHGGDYNSYLNLLKAEKETKDVRLHDSILEQIKRIEDMYKSVDVRTSYVRNLRFIAKWGDGRVLAKEKEITVQNILLHMGRYLWQERAKAAYFLNNVTPEQLKRDDKTWDDIFTSLITNLNNEEWSLLSRITALDTYSNLTQKTSAPFNASKIFDFEKAIEHWNTNGKKIIEEKNKLLANPYTGQPPSINP